ncbi:MAG: cobalt-zinc-cadmium efflux system membrane fusion protein [Pirellulaceae bacterium]|jgi:cobalt-zinc-cadmium efflux system membrane fusion protein
MFAFAFSFGLRMMKMNSFLQKNLQTAISVVLVAVLAIAGAATRSYWLPLVFGTKTAEDDHGHDHGPGADPHAGHDSGNKPDPHAGHDHGEIESIELSAMALRNIGLTTKVIGLTDYVKTTSIPAVVVERPGRSQVEVSAPLTGTVTRIYPVQGQAIQPGTPLFDIRLTHEDLVVAQRDFLRIAQELDVVKREIARMKSVGDGAIAGRRILEQEYELEKLQAGFYAQQQGLLLHGLSGDQISEIESKRRLIHQLTVIAPPFSDASEHAGITHLYHVQRIGVKRGQHVTAGDSLSVFGDHCLLNVEGQAFEDDIEDIMRAMRAGTPLEVTPVGSEPGSVDALKLPIRFIGDHVDEDSRTLQFYMMLTNQLTDPGKDVGDRFVTWKFRPGQRFEVHLPVSAAWKQQIVLPNDAIVDEGAEAYVFVKHEKEFERFPVHILYRGTHEVVVERNEELIGRTVAVTGAFQMHLAIKSKLGGGGGAHAGHMH